MAMLSIINQTRKPDKFIVFDDTKEPRDPRTIEHYMYLFKLMDQKGISWEWIWGHKKGAHHSHEMANTAGFDMAWFIDDDCVAEPTCLEELLKEMKDDVGAVGGLIPQPPAALLPPNVTNNRIADLTSMPNIQWFVWDGPPRQVEHIYSQFLYRCGIVHHDLRLSSVVFRGETMFTHSLMLKGYKLMVTPKAVTWHFQTTGGIHDGQKKENWNRDEWIFRQWLEFKRTGKKLYVLDNGLGDHYMFLQAVNPPKDAMIACCYPDVFKGYTNIISIADAQKLVDIKDYDVYLWCVHHGWKGSLVEAFRRLYEDLDRPR
jgi:hypothetical protein